MDIDDELELLQRELMAVQEEKTNPLSERTVAEIMVKLHHEGFAFFPTTDGNEYLTPQQLDAEIETLIRERGRINLTIIPQILNIGPDTIQSRLNVVLQRGNISRHANNLISHRYFDQLLATLKQRLESQGKIELEQVAIDHELNVKFVEKLVGEHLEQLSAELVGNQLITKEYTLLKKSKVLGFLSALSSPLSLDAFVKASGIENRNIEETVLQLITQGRLKGKCQSSYYIPDRFTANQKRIVTQFYENNGFVDVQMLQRKFLVTKPEEWLSKNLPAGSYVKIEKHYFKPEKLQSFGAQANSLLKSDGFVELSHILPVELDEKNLHYFLEEYCKLKDYFVCEGYCYSNEWLQRLAAEFKERIVYGIFFKKPEGKGKDKDKKKGKKERSQLTEEELQETLFNCGFAQYSVAENLAPELLPLMNQRIQQLRKKIEKQLAQSKGFINSTFLKYKSCKSILRSQESLTRMVNIIAKQQKKEKWSDGDFGPSEADKSGLYSLIYYDNAAVKGWPGLETLKWAEVKPTELLQADPNDTHSNLKKSHLTSLLEIIDIHNSLSAKKIPQPQLAKITQQSASPFLYQFFINQKDRRFVIVDDRLPMVNQRLFGSSGRFAFAEKAYAKLRYCYKAVMSVGIQQLILEMTGRSSLKYLVESEKDQSEILVVIDKHLLAGNLILLLGEGQAQKRLRIQEQQTDFLCGRLYSLRRQQGKLAIHPPITHQVQPKHIASLFKNIYVIQC